MTRTGAGRALMLALAAVVALPASSWAQEADFLFDRPLFTLGIRAGWDRPGEDSDVFDFIQDELTIEEGDFAAATWGGELAVRLSERLELALNAAYTEGETRSEFRDWVDTDDNPIEQTTTFQRIPVTLGLKAYLLPRGRQISRYAWVPRSWAPYVGVAGGWVWSEFEQQGDFVDFVTLDIFTDRIRSRARSGTVHALAGADINLSRYLFANVEARYAWASAPLSDIFEDFEPIDLDGFRATVGLSVRLNGS